MKGRMTLLIPLLATMAAAVLATVGLVVAWPATAQAHHAVGCTQVPDNNSNNCFYIGENAGASVHTATQAGWSCTIEYKIDWGDGSPPEVVTKPPGTSDFLVHSYASPGLYTITRTGKVISPSDPECYTHSWDDTKRIEVVSPIEITQLSLNDIDNQPLRFLSTDNHPYFGGNTRVHGSITVEGSPQDELTSLELEVDGVRVAAKADLSPAARSELLNKQFGSDGKLSFSSQSEPLFLLPASRADLFDSPNNGKVELRVVAVNQAGQQAKKTFGLVPKLVRYDAPNRYGTRAAGRGGDDWVLPSVRTAASRLRSVVPGLLWGDFSNMNGGPFPRHKLHQEGRDVDGYFAKYKARDGAVARRLLKILRAPTYGTRIQEVYVTFNKPGGRLLKCENRKTDTNHSGFWKAIQKQTVPAPGGGTRPARSVIKIDKAHCGHFHLRFFQP